MLQALLIASACPGTLSPGHLFHSSASLVLSHAGQSLPSTLACDSSVLNHQRNELPCPTTVHFSAWTVRWQHSPQHPSDRTVTTPQMAEGGVGSHPAARSVSHVWLLLLRAQAHQPDVAELPPPAAAAHHRAGHLQP